MRAPLARDRRRARHGARLPPLRIRCHARLAGSATSAQVDLRAAANVTIRTRAPAISVHADGDPKLVDRLTAEVRRGRAGARLGAGKPPVHNNGHHLDISSHHAAHHQRRARRRGIDRARSRQRAGLRREASAAPARSRSPRSHAARTVLAMSGAGEIVVAGRDRCTLEADASGVGSIDASGADWPNPAASRCRAPAMSMPASTAPAERLDVR